MDVDNLLKDVGSYFKNKILTGDYEFVKCCGITATILVDGKYIFELWIADTPKFHFGFYNNTYVSFMYVESMHLNTQKERMQGWKHIKPHITKYRKEVLKREKQGKINQLKKELKRLE